MKHPKVLIRKYSDRRLYDTTNSRYVKLKDIARMVRDGVEVRVVDGRSGKDLTHIILTQIVVEDAKQRQLALPLELLTQLVRASDKASHDFLSWYLNSTLDLYQKAQSAVKTGLSEAKSVVSNPLDFVHKLLEGRAWPAAPQGASEVDKLRSRVEELEALLAQRGQPPRRAPKRKRSTKQPG